MTPNLRGDNGFWHLPGFLSQAEQAALVEHARQIITEAPLLTPTMPDGSKFHLRLTNAGTWGWWSGPPLRGAVGPASHFRYVGRHPETGKMWPIMPAFLLGLCDRATEAAGLPRLQPDNLLINSYEADGSLGLHQDKTEQDQDAPIVSMSIGAEALFLLGGMERRDKATEVLVQSGDLVIQSGWSRRVFHGIKKVYPTLGNPLRNGGRLNFTFRRVVPQ